MARSRRSNTAIASLPLTKHFESPTRRAMAVSVDMHFSYSGSVPGSRFFGRAAASRAGVLEGDLGGHVGEDARVLLVDPDPNFDRPLVAVGLRHDADDRGRDRPVRVRVERDRNWHAGLNAADERLVNVDVDFDRIHVDEGEYAGAREATDRQQGDHLAR